MDTTHSDLVSVDLDDAERFMLERGVFTWMGPVTPTEELAVAMGFESTRHLFDDASRLFDLLKAGGPMSPTDWTRTMIMTEIGFSSHVFACAYRWSTITGIPDDEAVVSLRRLQRKLAQICHAGRDQIGRVLPRRGLGETPSGEA